MVHFAFELARSLRSVFISSIISGLRQIGLLLSSLCTTTLSLTDLLEFVLFSINFGVLPYECFKNGLLLLFNISLLHLVSLYFAKVGDLMSLLDLET